MRGLFSSDPATAAVPAGAGGTPGIVKLAIAGAAAAGSIAIIMWPSFFPTPPPQPPAPVERHQAPRISEYQSTPPAQDLASRMTGGPPPARRRPVPTEMSLYTDTKIISGLTAGAMAATAAPRSPEEGEPSGQSAAAGWGGGGANSALNAAVTGATILPTSHATLVRNPDFVIRAGDSVPCLPVAAQNSSRPGFHTCRVPEWFRGSNQRRGLLPPGSRFFGQIRSGLQQNEERLGVLFTMIQTPWFDQPLAAPGADAMGRAGYDGDLHTFFWDRAGAVAAYALLDMAVGTGQNLASNALTQTFSNVRGGFVTLNMGNQSQSLAGKEFDRTINKAPVLTGDEAMPKTVTIGQNLDFTDACRQAMRVDPMACPLL